MLPAEARRLPSGERKATPHTFRRMRKLCRKSMLSSEVAGTSAVSGLGETIMCYAALRISRY